MLNLHINDMQISNQETLGNIELFSLFKEIIFRFV